jgi:hypothetical protein
VRYERCLDSYVNDVLNHDTLGSTPSQSRFAPTWLLYFRPVQQKVQQRRPPANSSRWTHSPGGPPLTQALSKARSPSHRPPLQGNHSGLALRVNIGVWTKGASSIPIEAITRLVGGQMDRSHGLRPAAKKPPTKESPKPIMVGRAVCMTTAGEQRTRPGIRASMARAKVAPALLGGA